jgi:hypothetical protein
MTAQLTHDATPEVGTAQPTSTASRALVRDTFRRIHLAVQEMNLASRRLVELQAPWTVDKQWHRK